LLLLGIVLYCVVYVVWLVVDFDFGLVGIVVGMMSIGDVVLFDECVYIGWIGYGLCWWVSVVNFECKF